MQKRCRSTVCKWPNYTYFFEKRRNKKVLSAYDGLDVEAEMHRLIDNLSETEKVIPAATEESRDLLSALLNFREKEAETKVIIRIFNP